MLNRLLQTIGSVYPLIGKDAGEYQKLNVAGMDFLITPYEADGLGNVCTMDVSGMNGMMRMQTLVINPFNIDAPMLSYDRIAAMGSDTLYLEIFDTQLKAAFDESGFTGIHEKYAALPGFDPGKHWYDSMRLQSSIYKKGAGIGAEIDALAVEFLENWLAETRKAPACDIEAKRSRAGEYSMGLIENGGPATDPFLKQFGKEKTAEFFRTALFGI